MAELSHDRLTAILDAYGADTRRWPPQERDAALALLRANATMRAAFDRAVALDVSLDDFTVDPPSSALHARLIASAPRQRFERKARAAWAALAMAMAGIAGVAAGTAAAAALVTPAGVAAGDDEPTAFGDFGIEEALP